MKTFSKRVFSQLEIDLYRLAAEHDLSPAFVEVIPLENDFHGKVWSLKTERYDSTLEDYLKSHPEQEITLLSEAHRLLSELHRLGYGHGDLHLQNFVVNENGKVRLIDFGESFKKTNNIPANYQRYLNLVDLFPYDDSDETYSQLEHLEHSIVNWQFWFLKNEDVACNCCQRRFCLVDSFWCQVCKPQNDSRAKQKF